MNRKLILIAAVCCTALIAPGVADANHKSHGKRGEVSKRKKAHAVAVKECTIQQHQVGAVEFREIYGSFQGCVAEIIDEARVAVAQAIEECLGGEKVFGRNRREGHGNGAGGHGHGYGRCINRRALEILQGLLAEPEVPGEDPPPPPPPGEDPPPPLPLSCPVDLPESTMAGLADFAFPDLSGVTLSPELAQQIETFKAYQAELQELLALLAGQTGPIAQLLLDQLNFIESQLRAMIPSLEQQLNTELCPA
jgi:hypothetical protein